MKVLLHINSSQWKIEEEELTLAQAFQLLENQDSFEDLNDNFIGFTITAAPHAILQFVRDTSDSWTVDIPIFQNEKFLMALSGQAEHHQVFRMVRDFFDETSKLYSLLTTKQHEDLSKLFLRNYATSL